MNSDALMAAIERALGAPVRTVAPLAGGQICAAYRVGAGAATVVVKVNNAGPAGMFRAEADGLALLRRTGAIRTPNVVAVNDGPGVATEERFIALEYCSPDLDVDSGFGKRFGRALAAMHSAGPSPNSQYGLRADNFIGNAVQTNSWTGDWSEFYVRRRIEPQLAHAAPILGSLTARVEKVAALAPGLLAEMAHQPCVVHGDLWSGNFLVNGGEPVLIDPAAYYGHPEVEWAYCDLFGGFPDGMREGYDEVLPLAPGYGERRPLLQLYHLLLHACHFGARYMRPIEAVCAYYGV